MGGLFFQDLSFFVWFTPNYLKLPISVKVTCTFTYVILDLY